MCLVAISWKTNPSFPLLISANRDEFFDRPSAKLHKWENGIIAGKDLKSGGTWMGFHPNGKWALVTNFRDFKRKKVAEISRGKLVTDFLENEVDPEDYLGMLEKSKDKFDGFNLLVSDGDRLFYFSNYGSGILEIQPGIHGLSNGLINDPWPKIDLAKSQMVNISDEQPSSDNLIEILKSTQTYPLELLPKTGASPEVEIKLSSQLIRMEPNYGTVSSSSVMRDQNGHTKILERTFSWDVHNYHDISLSFQP